MYNKMAAVMAMKGPVGAKLAAAAARRQRAEAEVARLTRAVADIEFIARETGHVSRSFGEATAALGLAERLLKEAKASEAEIAPQVAAELAALDERLAELNATYVALEADAGAE